MNVAQQLQAGGDVAELTDASAEVSGDSESAASHDDSELS